MIYQHSLFPLGCSVLAMVAVLALVRRGRFGWAALAGAAGASTYPPVVIGGVVLAAWVALDGRVERTAVRRPPRQRLREAACLSGGFLAGTLVVIGDLWAETGRPDAYLLTQAKYHHSLEFPVIGSLHAAHDLLHGQLGSRVMPDIQSLFVLLLVAVLLGAVAYWRSSGGIEVASVCLVLAFWAFPASLDGISDYRSDALLSCGALALTRLPPLVAAALAGGAALLALPMSQAFVQSLLT